MYGPVDVRYDYADWWNDRRGKYPFRAHTFAANSSNVDPRKVDDGRFGQIVSAPSNYGGRVWGFATERFRDLFVKAYNATALA